MKPEFFGVFDLMIGGGWLFLLIVLLWAIRLKNIEKPHYKWFMPAMLFKLGFGLLFALTYTKILAEGGDTLAYWEGAIDLNNLFWDSPSAYFAELFQTPSRETISQNFNHRTGYPPSWIYFEPESFFICKILSFFTFFTFNSYIAMTLFCALIAGFSSWKFFELTRRFTFCKPWVIIFATLFIPTVAFWCTGISKDTFVVAAFQIIVALLFSKLLYKKPMHLFSFFLIVVSVFVLFKVRDFMLIATFVPFMIVLLIRLSKK
ncbi:hypothetical protein CW751_11190 [Brumimicrobium salinarum]|uniref:Glycosyltransferase RgtA/B/C/D-like domain-containing protein n=1 Tax=Brumimicrobium salinarum TaxID=2058658 RepID=A0A2I0R0X7_9FLAO|nr:hypothetical protein [Brumimicrobium salinarum]PKR80219.1 hypothetical protein CW751_11190 [Brumimicrobium salinarum]